MPDLPFPGEAPPWGEKLNNALRQRFNALINSLGSHSNASTQVHGIPDTSKLVDSDDLAELQDSLMGTIGAEVEQHVPPRIVANLWDDSAATLGNLSATGNVFPHERNLVSPFIPVSAGQPYRSFTATPSLLRIVWYDAARVYIPGTNTDNLAGEQAWTAPDNAAYARLGVAIATGQTSWTVIFNEGTRLVNPDDPGGPTGYWNGREKPPLDDNEVQLRHLALPKRGDKIADVAVDGAVPERKLLTNMWDDDAATLGNLSDTGNVSDHHTNLVSPLLPVTAGREYRSSVTPGLLRVVWYDASQTAISGTYTDWHTGEQAWTAPTGAAFVRLGLAPTSTGSTVIFNEGDHLVDPDAPEVVPTGFWDDRELPPLPGPGIDEEQLNEMVQTQVTAAVGHIEPSTPTLTFETVGTGWDRPYWLSEDGVMLYGRRGHILVQSDDEWATRTDVHAFDGSIQAVRTLGDGELLVSLGRDEANNVKARLYKSTGYTREDPTAATWAQVLEAGATQANINNTWGLQVYANIVVAGEYGLRGENGARRVWMSEDHGTTWSLVFDQKTVDAPGRPAWTENGHVHTAAWDPYWQRLWVVVGDNPNTATYYSDNPLDPTPTWVFVTGSTEVQYTGIMPLPDVVLFGSDRAPNGLHAYRRGLKSDMPRIRPLMLVDTEDVLTRVFQLPYRRDWSPTSPTYFAATPAAGRGPSVICGTVDGKKGHLLWTAAHPSTGGELSGNVPVALGPTAQGNIIAYMEADPTVTGDRILKAPAPTWQRV